MLKDTFQMQVQQLLKDEGVVTLLKDIAYIIDNEPDGIYASDESKLAKDHAEQIREFAKSLFPDSDPE